MITKSDNGKKIILVLYIDMHTCIYWNLFAVT